MLERRLKSLPENEGDVYEPDKITRKIIYAIDKNVSLDDMRPSYILCNCHLD